MTVAAGDWNNAARYAGNLSELHLALGDLEAAEALGRAAVEHADDSGDEFHRLAMRTTHADALHHLGRTDEARALFEEAERMQAAWQPQDPLLYSLQGYQYCDLLLAAGEHGEVLRRATKALEVSTSNRWLLDIALDHFALGRALLSAGDLPAAEPHLRDAVDGLRAAGQQDELPRGLLARAEYHLANADPPRPAATSPRPAAWSPAASCASSSPSSTSWRPASTRRRRLPDGRPSPRRRPRRRRALRDPGRADAAGGPRAGRLRTLARWTAAAG